MPLHLYCNSAASDEHRSPCSADTKRIGARVSATVRQYVIVKDSSQLFVFATALPREYQGWVRLLPKRSILVCNAFPFQHSIPASLPAV